MQRSSADRIKLQHGGRENFGTSRIRSNPNAMQVLYILLMTPGVFATFLALSLYPAINTRLGSDAMPFPSFRSPDSVECCGK